MPARRTNALSLKATKPRSHGKPDLRDYSSFKNPGKRPSADFDWDRALLGLALLMWDLGYELSAKQKKRIEDNAQRT
jgi:hypothetical protein